jgi:hypothetical protein
MRWITTHKDMKEHMTASLPRRSTKYRGYDITVDAGVVWVDTPAGPFDAPTIARAKQYIDAIIAENAE